jgi:imidazolonepropionase-like amidohydrolase
MRATVLFAVVWLAQFPAAPDAPIALTNVTVIDVAAGQRLSGRTVIVDGGRIVRADADSRVAVPPAARRIDGSGRFLIPGLINTHVHLAAHPGREHPEGLGPLLANGLTTVRDAGTGGQDQRLVSLRDAVERGELLAPRIYVSGMVTRRNMMRYGAADGGALARQLIAWRVDGLKIRDGLTMDDVRAVVAEGARARIPVYGHTYDPRTRNRDEVYTLEAIRAGVNGTMHISGSPQLGSNRPPVAPAFAPDEWQRAWLSYSTWWLHTDVEAERTLIDTMVSRNAWLEPTLITEDWIANAEAYRASWSARAFPGVFERAHEGFPIYTGSDLEQFQAVFARMKDFVRRFHAAGGMVIAGTDCVLTIPYCGYDLQDELRLLVDAGLPPAAALRAATLDAARALGWSDRLGRVEAGALADLVLLDGDPLTDIGNTGRIHAVITRGRYLDRTTLDRLLQRDRDPARLR